MRNFHGAAVNETCIHVCSCNFQAAQNEQPQLMEVQCTALSPCRNASRSFAASLLVPCPVMDDGWQGKLARASVGLLGFIEDKDFLWHATTKRHGIHLAAASSWIRTQPRSIFPASRSRVWIQKLHFVFKILRGFVLHQKVLLILVCTGQRATCLYWYSFVNSCLEFFFRGRY